VIEAPQPGSAGALSATEERTGDGGLVHTMSICPCDLASSSIGVLTRSRPAAKV
jgi:hypothetical protein